MPGLQLYQKESLAQVFFCEFCEISKNTFFTEYVWKTASERITIYLSTLPSYTVQVDAYLPRVVFIYLDQQQCTLFSYTRYIRYLSSYILLFYFNFTRSQSGVILPQWLAAYTTQMAASSSFIDHSTCVRQLNPGRKTFPLVMYRLESSFTANFFVVFSHSF